MQDNMDLTICQDCKKNPATYGDGVTWSRCSSCQRAHMETEGAFTEAKTPEAPEQSFEHTIVPGLTSIIIPIYMTNYTLFHYTGNCIGSVREHTKEGDYEIVIVDNGSPLQPPTLQSYYAHRVIKNETNLGVTKAWNQGIRVSVGEYIVLLNNDVQVFDHWLEDLKEIIDNGGYDLVMAHPMYSLTEPFARALESRKIRNEVIASGKVTSDFKDFSCVMFKRSLLDEIGLFDERFFNYCSDSDMFDRLEKAGKKWACAEVVPTSHISDATGYSLPETPEVMNEDKRRYELKQAEIRVKPEDLQGNYEVKIDQNNMEKPEKLTSLMRSNETGDAIFLVASDGKRHKIKDPETLNALGFDFGLEQSVSKETLDQFELGEEINMENYQSYA